MNDNRKVIGIFDLFAVFRRALLIQAAWSFDRMQTLGFAYAIEPALRKVYPDRAEYAERLKVHLEYFNTQPYLASFIMGAAVRLEEERATGRTEAPDVSRLKAALMAPLGALGDSLFWGALKPLAAAAAAAVLMTGSWWAPFLFLAIFNLWHLGLRMGMLFWGYASGGDAVALMGKYHITKMAKRFKLMSLCILGGILGMMPFWRPEFNPSYHAPGVVVSLSAMLLTLALVAVMRRGGSPVKFMLGLAALCVALAYAGAV
ncbi:MAG TPA: PTS system mannose/fructose/sorbose family transporter subunit IID [Nitrospirota bacterium]|nr:PTS system mannose/fructose/sorbose family transporter subunit IID [Nitrospirota bacterium]